MTNTGDSTHWCLDCISESHVPRARTIKGHAKGKHRCKKYMSRVQEPNAVERSEKVHHVVIEISAAGG